MNIIIAAYVAEFIDNKDVNFWTKWRGLRTNCKELVSEDIDKNFVNNIKNNFSKKIFF